MSNQMQKRDSQLIFGRNAVLEAIKAGAAIDKLYVAPVEQKGSIRQFISLAKSAGYSYVTGQKSCMRHHRNQAHQGVVATIAAAAYATMDQVWKKWLPEKGEEKLFLILADEIRSTAVLGDDPETAECCGAHGIVVPKRRSAGLSPDSV